jgi:DNA-directed RNA polymerase alpha subunit
MVEPFDGRPLDKVLIEEIVGPEVADNGLGERAYSCLKHHRIDTVGELIAMEPEQLMALDGVGNKILETIIGKLFAHGLALSGEPWMQGRRGRMMPVSKVGVELLDLGVAAYNVLRREGFRTVADLLDKSEVEIRDVFERRMLTSFANKRMIDEIVRELARYCLTLRYI